MHFLVISALIIIVPLIVVIRNYKKEATLYKTITQSMVFTAAAVIGILLGVYMTGQTLGSQFMDTAGMMASMAAGSEEFIAQLGLADMTYDERVTYITNAYAAVSQTFPSTIIISTFMSAYFIYMAVDKMHAAKNNTQVRLMPFKFFRWPAQFVIGFLFIFLLAWLVEMLSPALYDAALYTNISMIFEFAVAAEGLAVIFFFFDAKKLPKIFPIFIGAFGLISGIGRIVLFAIGFLDYMFNFRLRAEQGGKR